MVSFGSLPASQFKSIPLKWISNIWCKVFSNCRSWDQLWRQYPGWKPNPAHRSLRQCRIYIRRNMELYENNSHSCRSRMRLMGGVYPTGTWYLSARPLSIPIHRMKRSILRLFRNSGISWWKPWKGSGEMTELKNRKRPWLKAFFIF